MNIITCFYVFKSYIAALIGTKEMYFIKLHLKHVKLFRVLLKCITVNFANCRISYRKIYSFSLNVIFHMSNVQYLEYLLCVDVLNYTFVIQWTSQ